MVGQDNLQTFKFKPLLGKRKSNFPSTINIVYNSLFYNKRSFVNNNRSRFRYLTAA